MSESLVEVLDDHGKLKQPSVSITSKVTILVFPRLVRDQAFPFATVPSVECAMANAS